MIDLRRGLAIANDQNVIAERQAALFAVVVGDLHLEQACIEVASPVRGDEGGDYCLGIRFSFIHRRPIDQLGLSRLPDSLRMDPPDRASSGAGCDAPACWRIQGTLIPRIR
jgi:hypothetical protein